MSLEASGEAGLEAEGEVAAREFISKVSHSYVLASLLMALEPLPLLIFEIRDRSALFRL